VKQFSNFTGEELVVAAEFRIKVGIATKRKKAGWDHEYLATLLGYAVN
jgi:hypothetical protein